MEVTRGHQQFFANNLREPNEIETWNCCHCVCLRKAHRMMYNLTYLGHRVTLPSLDLRSNFDLDLSRSNYTWFDAPWRDKHYGIKIVARPLKVKTVSSKNHFGKFWNFDPWRPQFWPEPKMIEMISKWFSRAFERRFPFCSTMRRSRDRWGGVFKHPPSRWWKIQRPSRARVKVIEKNRKWWWKTLYTLYCKTLLDLTSGHDKQCRIKNITSFFHHVFVNNLLPKHDRTVILHQLSKNILFVHAVCGGLPITISNTYTYFDFNFFE